MRTVGNPYEKVLVKYGLNPANYDFRLDSGFTLAHTGEGASFEVADDNTRLKADTFGGSRYVERLGDGHYVARSDNRSFYSFSMEFWLDSEGRYHRPDSPAYIYKDRRRGRAETEITELWYWHGKDGLEHFPDDVLAKIGDTVI